SVASEKSGFGKLACSQRGGHLYRMSEFVPVTFMKPWLFLRTSREMSFWPLLLALSLASLLSARAGVTNYFTGFEAPAYSTSSPLYGLNGWTGVEFDDANNQVTPGSEGNGIVNGAIPGLGQQAFIGNTPLPSGYGPLYLWQPLNLDPI